MYAKAKATDEDRERAKNTPPPPTSGGRGDTWTDRSTPIYDHRGNEIGRLNNDNSHWENDRR